MKVKNLIKELEGLEQDKDIIINSDEAFIGTIGDLGSAYCIYGTDNREDNIKVSPHYLKMFFRNS